MNSVYVVSSNKGEVRAFESALQAVGEAMYMTYLTRNCEALGEDSDRVRQGHRIVYATSRRQVTVQQCVIEEKF